MSPLLALVIQNLPSVIQQIKDAHAKANPDLPPLEDQDVRDALKQAIMSSELKDDQWLAAHPEPGPVQG